MRVYMNFAEVKGPYGGANSFMRSLRDWLRGQGVVICTGQTERFDVALLNALEAKLNLGTVRSIADRGVPIVHRKTGYSVSGSAEMRRRVDGVVWGDKLQIDFGPCISTTVFQSHYSQDVFHRSGFQGSFRVIHNGVDERMFNQLLRVGWLRRRQRPRCFWTRQEPLRVIISTWSNDYNKGFHHYRAIDEALAGRREVEVSLVGRKPNDLEFRHIRVFGPQSPTRLAETLKRAHVFLQLSQSETCSNALIEGINCGLPVIYLDSGANREVAEPYGVEYRGDWWTAMEAVVQRYEDLLAATARNPYRMSVVGPQYLALLNAAAR